jgi:N-acetylmuramic acid 6-phosphate etherase
MVDVQATNQKLARRSETMLAHLTGRPPEEVRAALDTAQGSVKLAVLVLQGCPAGEAKALLTRCGGKLRLALSRFREERAGQV